MMMLGIISYLPKDEVNRQKRIKARNKQREFLKSIFPDKTQNVVCQCYKEEELNKEDNNLVFEKGIGVGGARNELLKIFYESDYDHILIMDDDLSLYDYYNPIEFLQDIDANPDKYKDLDVILSWTPQYVAFKKDMYKDGNNKKYFKFTQQSPYWVNGIVIISKRMKPQMYDDKKDLNVEDVGFNINAMKSGKKVYVANFLQMKLLVPSNDANSVAFDEFNGGRVNHEINLRLKLAERYGIPVTGTTVHFKKALDLWGIHYLTPLYIPRVTTYEYIERLIPKDKTNKHTLF